MNIVNSKKKANAYENIPMNDRYRFWLYVQI